MNEFYRRPLTWLLISYSALRALSFFLIDFAIARELIAAVLIGFFIYFCIKNLSLAWKILVLELLLDGAGHFFDWNSLLLRTWVLGIFAGIWLWQKLRTRSRLSLPPKNIVTTLMIFGIFLAWALINGILRDNSTAFAVQDTILYLFILLLFPALEFEHDWQSLYTVATKVLIFGSTIFSVLTLALYSTHIFTLTDPYYHWFRNVAAGKITDLGLDFFRIVLPEQLLFVPIILILFSYLIKKVSDKKLWVLLACSLIVLTLNFTRIYFLGLIVGAIFLFYRAPWKNWLRAGSVTLAMFLAIFFSIHLATSRGESLGLELLGVRISGLRAPTTDVSGAIRMAMLPNIFSTITARPWFGSGLGTTVTYIDPATNTSQTRTQFDWGYLEMIAELGIVGTAAYLLLLATIIYNFARVHLQTYIGRGLLAGALALFIINITTPALFQGFGVLYFVFLAVASQHPQLITKNTD